MCRDIESPGVHSVFKRFILVFILRAVERQLETDDRRRVGRARYMTCPASVQRERQSSTTAGHSDSEMPMPGLGGSLT